MGITTRGGGGGCHNSPPPPKTQSKGPRPQNGGAEASGQSEAQSRAPPTPHSHVSNGVLGWGGALTTPGGGHNSLPLLPPSPPLQIGRADPQRPQNGGAEAAGPGEAQRRGGPATGGGVWGTPGGAPLCGGAAQSLRPQPAAPAVPGAEAEAEGGGGPQCPPPPRDPHRKVTLSSGLLLMAFLAPRGGVLSHNK